MKKSLAFALASSLLTTAIVSAQVINWTPIPVDGDVRYFFDVSTFKKENNVVTFLQKVENQKGLVGIFSGHRLTFIILVKYDCVNHLNQAGPHTDIIDTDTKAFISKEDNTWGSPHPILPGTIGEQIMEFVCSDNLFV